MNLENQERHLYDTVWKGPGFTAPKTSLAEAVRALTAFNMKPGQSLWDFGAGSAETTVWFRKEGIRAVAVDISEVPDQPDVPYLRANVFGGLPGSTPKDWGFCCDLMQHIPPLKIDIALSTMARLSKRGIWFRIPLRRDVLGPRFVGKPLHASVYDAKTWRSLLDQRLTNWKIQVIEDDGRSATIRADAPGKNQSCLLRFLRFG